METVFIYNGHRIVVVRDLIDMECFIDDTSCGKVKGFFKANSDQVFEGIAHNSDGSEDSIRVEFRDASMKKLLSTIALYYNGELVDEKKAL